MDKLDTDRIILWATAVCSALAVYGFESEQKDAKRKARHQGTEQAELTAINQRLDKIEKQLEEVLLKIR